MPRSAYGRAKTLREHLPKKQRPVVVEVAAVAAAEAAKPPVAKPVSQATMESTTIRGREKGQIS